MVTDYATLIKELLELDISDEARRRVLEAKAFEDENIVMPQKLAAYLRRLYESTRPPPCERLASNGACIWLTQRQPPGKVATCPFYPRGEDPRECSGYRPASSVPDRKEQSIVLYGDKPS